MRKLAAWLVPALLASLAGSAAALEECRLLRQPDMEGNRVVFVYGGDLWNVARTGGIAQRLTTHEGLEQFPKLSPDGRSVAFTAQYDGNTDVYVMPSDGGEPVRLTYHPGADQVADWYPDGRSILFRSRRSSAPDRFDRFFKVSVQGGFEEPLPLPLAGYANWNADGTRLAYVSPSYDNRTWKRYRGGNAPDIWIYDFKADKSEKITDWDGPDEWPMWHGTTVYYCSDRGGKTANIWAYDTRARAHRQVTTFAEYDVKWPSVGSDGMVFENGGTLYVMDLPSETLHKIQVMVPSDKPATRAELRNVSRWITDWALSPSAKRAVFAARGDIFTVPAEKGDPRNLTRTPGIRERDPSWSPDGKWISYLSDRGGEYQVCVIPGDGKGSERQVNTTFKTFLYAPAWSPDSKKLAFADKERSLWWLDVATGKATRVARSTRQELRDFAWAPDSRWIAYVESGANQFGRLHLYSLESGQASPILDGMTDESSPSFDPEGRYLYFLSRRTFNPLITGFELNFQFRRTDKVYCVTLNDSLRSPVAPQSDEEGVDSKSGADKAAAADKGTKPGSKPADKPAEKPATPSPVKIQFEGIADRVAEIPVRPGNYSGLSAAKGKLVFVEQPENDGAEGSGPRASLQYYDLEKREQKTVLSGVAPGYSLARDGGKLMYRSGEKFGIVDVAEGKKVGDGSMETAALMSMVDPRLEWMQMFNEAWRNERDFYYDPNMGGLDWNAVGARYRQLVPFAAHRTDLSYLFGEMIGELSTSHTYVAGGDWTQVRTIDVGLLGTDWTLDASSGLYRFSNVLRESDWNSDVRAPLGAPGVRVREGDWLLSVNGQPVRSPMNVYAAFLGTTGKQTTITVGGSATDAAPRTFTVVPVADDHSLRYAQWVRGNREKVLRATGGRIAYVHVPNTAIEGIQEFSKQYYAQVDKDGIIVDDRFNAGGFIPDFFVERLARSTLSYWSNRDGEGFRTPSSAIDGPKCILINQFAGSGGDAFPYYFRERKVGPVIGKRTWGGLVGISNSLPLMDGGAVTAPTFGMFDPDGKWAVENHGVDPDMDVENTPHEVVAGHDPQLEKAIEWSLQQLKDHPVKRPAHPPYKIR